MVRRIVDRQLYYSRLRVNVEDSLDRPVDQCPHLAEVVQPERGQEAEAESAAGDCVGEVAMIGSTSVRVPARP